MLSEGILQALTAPIWVFLCVLARIGPLLILLPPIRGNAVPLQVRVLLMIALTMCVTPMAIARSPNMPDEFAIVMVQLVLEIMMGLLFGTAVAVMVTGLQSGAAIVSQLAGLDNMTTVDANSQEETPVLGQLLSWLSIALFLGLGGHRQLLNLCLGSFELYPAGAILAQEAWLMQLVAIVQHGLELGLRAAAPLAIALILANVLTSLISRAMPQLNMLAIGFNVNALVLLSTLAISVGGIGWAFQEELVSWIEMTSELVTRTDNHG
jgi:flagellar biosynthesis protein FliR